MRGPYRKRRIIRPPQFVVFKPAGVRRKYLETIELTVDEYESIRLADYLQKDHQQAAQEMNISRPTFTRLIEKARSKLAHGIIEGKEIRIRGGNIDFVHTLHQCHECGEVVQQPYNEEQIDCPDCGSSNYENLAHAVMNKRRKRGQN